MDGRRAAPVEEGPRGRRRVLTGNLPILLHDEAGRWGQAGGGPLGQSRGVLGQVVARVARRGTGEGLACSGRDGGVRRCVEDGWQGDGAGSRT